VKQVNCLLSYLNNKGFEYMETKPIFNGYTAKQLVRKGNKIVDLQPDKNRRGATIFYFEVTEKFINDLKELSHNK